MPKDDGRLTMDDGTVECGKLNGGSVADCKMRVAGCMARSGDLADRAGCRMQDAECRMQSAGCKLNGYRPGYYDIAFGSHDRPALRW